MVDRVHKAGVDSAVYIDVRRNGGESGGGEDGGRGQSKTVHLHFERLRRLRGLSWSIDRIKDKETDAFSKESFPQTQFAQPATRGRLKTENGS